MTPEAWTAILRARDESDRAVERAREKIARLLAAAPDSAAAEPVLASLHLELRRHFEAMAAELSGVAIAESRRRQILAALSFFLNERARLRLSDAQRCDHEPLAVAGADPTRGGEAFFELLSDEPGDEARALHEVLYFCLVNGFAGRYIDDAPGLDALRAQLHARLTEAAQRSFSLEPPLPITPQLHPVLAYVASAALLALTYVLLIAFTN